MQLTESERFAILEALSDADFVSGFQKFLNNEAEMFDRDTNSAIRGEAPDFIPNQLKAVRSCARADFCRRALINELRGFTRPEED